MNKFKLGLAALGLSAALVAGPAAAVITWNPYPDFTVFQDDDLDFVFDSDLNPKAGGILEVGDVLGAIVELNDAGGIPIDEPEGSLELTGFSALQIQSIIPSGFPGLFNIFFAPYSGGLNTWLPDPVEGGEAGGGALVAWYTDTTPDLNIESSQLPGPLSCATFNECLAQATDGEIWQVDGFADPDNAWVAVNAALDTSLVLAGNPAQGFGQFNANISVIVNNTGVNLEPNSFSCAPFCAPGGDGFADVVGTGTILGSDGIEQSLIDTGAVATSDFDLSKRQAVPEPSTLALLAAGFVGLGVAQRRRRKG